MKKLTLAICLMCMASFAQDRSPQSEEARREPSAFRSYSAFASLYEGLTSDERIIFLKTPIGAFRLPASESVYTYFGPLRPPSAGFPSDPFSVP